MLLVLFVIGITDQSSFLSIVMNTSILQHYANVINLVFDLKYISFSLHPYSMKNSNQPEALVINLASVKPPIMPLLISYNKSIIASADIFNYNHIGACSQMADVDVAT